MFLNMSKEALKIRKGRQWSIPDKKGQQRCYSPIKFFPIFQMDKPRSYI